jgi:hypothetical protein
MKRPHAPVPQIDRTKFRICSAAELVPSVAAQEWNVEQSSPLRSQPHLLSKCGSRSSAQVACKAFHPHSLGERTSKLGRTIYIWAVLPRRAHFDHCGRHSLRAVSKLGRSIYIVRRAHSRVDQVTLPGRRASIARASSKQWQSRCRNCGLVCASIALLSSDRRFGRTRRRVRLQAVVRSPPRLQSCR